MLHGHVNMLQGHMNMFQEHINMLQEHVNMIQENMNMIQGHVNMLQENMNMLQGPVNMLQYTFSYRKLRFSDFGPDFDQKIRNFFGRNFKFELVLLQFCQKFPILRNFGPIFYLKI